MDLNQAGLLDILEELLVVYPQHRAALLAEAQARDATGFCRFLIDQKLLETEAARALFQKIQSFLQETVNATVVAKNAFESGPKGHAALVFNPEQLQSFLTSSGSVKLVGQLFASKYKIIREIGRGGMGLVLEAENVQTRSRVALKLCLADQHSIEESNRFRREAQILAQLDHPNIVQVNEYGHDNGVPYYTMEMLKGWSFRQEVEASLDQTGAGLDLERVLECLAPIAEALSYCHEKGVVHRDVKPDNILIEAETGRSILIDFGIVKRDPRRLGETLDGLSLSLTEAGVVLGTPAFMSPEQLDPKHFGEISGAADVWGLSATMFYGLTGVAPVPGESLINIFNAVLSGQIRKLRDLVPTVPKWFENLYQRGMLQDPEQRCSMADFEAALHQDPPRRSWLPIGIGFAITLALSFYLLWPVQPALGFQIEGVPSWTSQDQITLSGRTQRSVSFRVRRDGVVLYQSKRSERRLVLSVFLSKGINTFEIDVSSPDGEILDSRIIALTKDTAAPEMTFSVVKKLLFHGEDKVLVLDDQGQLEFVVNDESPVEVYLGKEKLEQNGDRRFVVKRRPDKESVETLQLRDGAGHESIYRVHILGPKGVKKRARAYDILTDLRVYEKASEAELDYLFEKVSELLGPHFKALTPQVFRCGGQQFRIQAYRHETTRVFFRLIPGGLYTLGVRNVDYEFKRALELDRQYRREWVTHATPARRVRVRPMLVAVTELSHGQWLSVFEEEDLNQKAVDFPMAGVSWTSAKDWLKKAGDGFRLPSEAEWEYAARGGTRSRFFWGDSVDFRYMVCRPQKGHEGKKVTGRMLFPNAFGLVDTLGNLWEFCEDSYVDNYSDLSLTGEPQRRTHSLISRRGGCFTYRASDCQVWTRSLGFDKDHSNAGTGFRVFVTVPGF